MTQQMTVSLRDIDTIFPYDKNAKKHDDAQVQRIAKSIKQFGWRGNPIIVDKDGVIIAGHGRRLAALSLGLKSVPVVVEQSMSAEEARAFRLADNRVAISDIDTDLLQQELADLDFDMVGIFDKKELEFISADLSAMNVDAFVSNLDEEVQAQSSETVSKIKETDEREVKIDKALGFKSIKGSDERVVARFMAVIEAETGKTGADAFVAFINELTI